MTEIDGTSILLAAGQYGTQIDGWNIRADGTLGARHDLTLTGGEPGAMTALVDTWIGGQHYFISASRHSAGLEVWRQQGDTLIATGRADISDFLTPGSVQALGLSTPGGVPYVLAVSAADDGLVAFPVLAGGGLGGPQRVSMYDGLFVDTPTQLQTVELAGRDFAIVGSAGSSSISVVRIYADGDMAVVSQVNDTMETGFDNLVALDALEAAGTVFVLAAGSDNGVSLMMLQPSGRLVHLASLHDALGEMALDDIGGLDMVWRDGGLDIFVTGEVLASNRAAGGGVSYLRVDDLQDGLPNVQVNTGSNTQTGITGEEDVFVLSDTDAAQIVHNFEPGVDRLDMSQFGRVYDVSELNISSISNGAVIRLDGAQVTVFTADGSRLQVADFENADVQDLWQIEVNPLPQAALFSQGTMGPDLVGGRDGADTLLGQPYDPDFDPCAAQVYRLYRAALDREPDVRGLINWSNRLESGENTLEQAAAGFTNSAEFTQTYGATDNRAFVTLLYNNVLDRAPDATGLDNWSGRLARGEMTRPEVLVGFSESAEFQNSTKAEAFGFSHATLQAGFGDEVYRLYQATLGREPDLGGFLNWAGRLADGMQFSAVVEGFTNSAEFTQTYGATDNRAFVTLLYNNVLDRAPDATGLNNWAGRLARGEMTRSEVVTGFSESAEFRNASAADMARWVARQGNDDILDGEGGENILVGGVLSDTFVFRASENGQHVVVDLEPWDILRMEGFGYDDAADMAEHLRTDGGDVVFTDSGVEIRFLDVTIHEVRELEFEF
ncbi:DUF4214 domain-containing protein [Phaeobacter sp. J2-8]|uniref:DUF4214 domain-containing protein n=1 Tax=Phaeobacter sp. J2-8 TaxID=2931394 RepID=UPI001FD04F35|nr:DUF4214 domain-containing protein [Phaeobacter sp. J2-8]MCJ7874805.1 DUF4214 domain-containing protein [Phaeobacter sp. J2-8]